MKLPCPQLWVLHGSVLTACLLAPPVWTRVVAPSPRSQQGPVAETYADATEEDMASYLQVEAKVDSGGHEPPAKTKDDADDDAEIDDVEDLGVYVRPTLGGQADIVHFAIYMKNFFGMKFSKNMFSTDVVLTLSWKDIRAASMVPEGTENVTMRTSAAKKRMWLPDVAVSNRAIGGPELISSAVQVTKNGSVRKTERLLLHVKQHFDVRAFPFDMQQPKIILASATLMAQDLKLREDKSDRDLAGIKPHLFEDREFRYVSDDTSVFEETDGNLVKSRGMLVITLQRDWTRYLQTTILPELFLILISFTVFWMPRATPFAMPRVATNLISFLTLMTLSINTSRMLPQDRQGMAWIELFADTMQMQNCLILFLNVYVDWVYNNLDLKDLGEKMTNELAGLFPLMGSVVVVICFSSTSGRNLSFMQMIIRGFMFGVQGIWITFGMRRVREAQEKREQES